MPSPGGAVQGRLGCGPADPGWAVDRRVAACEDRRMSRPAPAESGQPDESSQQGGGCAAVCPRVGGRAPWRWRRRLLN